MSSRLSKKLFPLVGTQENNMNMFQSGKHFFALSFIAALSLQPQLSHADETNSTVDNDSTFISLTRKPTDLDHLPTNTTVITQKEIKLSGAKTVADLLALTASADTGRSGSLGSSAFLRLRGVPSSGQVQILVDDQPLGGASIQNTNINLIPVENIERIEIVRGGASVLYGANTIGGVVNIITKKAKNEGTHLTESVEVGSFQTVIGSVEATHRTGGFHTSVNALKYKTEGFEQNNAAENFETAGKVGYTAENGEQIELAASNVNRNERTPSGTPVPFELWDGHAERVPNTPTQSLQNNMTLYRLSGVLPVGTAVLKTLIYHSRERYQIRFDDTSDPFSTFDNRITGNDTRFILQNGFTIGGATEFDQRISLGQSGRHILNTAAYTEIPLRFNSLTLTPAVRYDHHSAFGAETNPRLTAVFLANDNLKFSANIARSYRAPTLVDLYDDFLDPFFPAFNFYANPNLQPEKAWTYDAGTEIKMFGQTTLSLTGFFSRITDRIVGVDSNNDFIVDTLDNVSNSETAGTETELKTVTGPFAHNFNYTFQRSRESSTNSSQFVEARMTPAHRINYQQNWTIAPDLNLLNTVQYVSTQFQLDDRTGVRLHPFAVWNARLEKRFDTTSVYFKVNNIANRRYAESITYSNAVPQPVRTYWIGMMFHFVPAPLSK